jgi:hypothetical protein
MTIKEAFLVGFARQLANSGVSPSELDTLCKQALGPQTITAPVKDLSEATKNFLSSISPAAKAMGTATLIGVPAIAGWMLGGSSRVNKADLDAVAQESLLQEYADAISRLKEEQEDAKKMESKVAAVVGNLNTETTKLPPARNQGDPKAVLGSAAQGFISQPPTQQSGPIKNNIAVAAQHVGSPSTKNLARPR